jgi:hypothetical protein
MAAEISLVRITNLFNGMTGRLIGISYCDNGECLTELTIKEFDHADPQGYSVYKDIKKMKRQEPYPPNANLQLNYVCWLLKELVLEVSEHPECFEKMVEDHKKTRQ